MNVSRSLISQADSHVLTISVLIFEDGVIVDDNAVKISILKVLL